VSAALPTALFAALSTPWLWQLVVGSLVGLALLWWGVRGAQRWRRIRSLRRALGTAPQGVDAQALTGAFDAACDDLQRQHPGAGRMALYERPWVLFLAEAGSRVGDLLHTAAPEAPVHGQLPQSFWRWHLLPQLVAIEVDPRLIDAAGPDETHAPDGAGGVASHWLQAVLLLVQRRGALPLDGIVLCADAQSLLQGNAEALATRLRRRADEISQHLHLRLPTQILVTGLDRIQGFEPVRAMLPEPLRQQAVGIRVPPGRLLVIDDVLDELANRVRALRMGLVRQHRRADQQLAAHRFFGQCLLMQASLSTLLKRLFAPGKAPYRMRGRGLYFVAAPGAADANVEAAFVKDVFERFLPAERAFTRRRR
jgi:type VI protein secretion system component VasK